MTPTAVKDLLDWATDVYKFNSAMALTLTRLAAQAPTPLSLYLTIMAAGSSDAAHTAEIIIMELAE
jgi:hypothetical protein